MIDLRGVWLPQIIGYAEFVSEEQDLRSAWIDGDRSTTSVTDYDEMFEQIFGGLDVENQLVLAKSEFGDDPGLIALIANFIDGLNDLDRTVVDNDLSHQPEQILALVDWASFRERAQKVATYAARHGYTTDVVFD